MVAAGHWGPRAFREAELIRWGAQVGATVEPPLWIALVGPLGAGKSVLARAISRGAGIEGYLPSPTFTLVQDYSSPRSFRIHHVDLFRLEAGDPLEPLGWEDLVRSTGLVLVEWADRATDQLPSDRWDVRMEYGETPEQRTVTLARRGSAPDPVDWPT